MASPHLLRLPRELRDMIYEHIFILYAEESQRPSQPPTNTLRPVVDRPTPMCGTMHRVPQIAVNRQMHAEFLDMFYKYTQHYFESHYLHSPASSVDVSQNNLLLWRCNMDPPQGDSTLAPYFDSLRHIRNLEACVHVPHGETYAVKVRWTRCSRDIIDNIHTIVDSLPELRDLTVTMFLGRSVLERIRDPHSALEKFAAFLSYRPRVKKNLQVVRMRIAAGGAWHRLSIYESTVKISAGGKITSTVTLRDLDFWLDQSLHCLVEHMRRLRTPSTFKEHREFLRDLEDFYAEWKWQGKPKGRRMIDHNSDGS